MSILQNMQLAAMTKEAAPDYTNAAIPYAQRRKEFTRHIKRTAKRKKPNYSTGMAVGGLVGGAIGSIAGVPNAAVVGGVVGGIGGAFLGALAVGSDRAAIDEAKRVQRSGNYDKNLIKTIKSQTASVEFRASLGRAHRDARDSSRHQSIARRLDRMERRQISANPHRY